MFWKINFYSRLKEAVREATLTGSGEVNPVGPADPLGPAVPVGPFDPAQTQIIPEQPPSSPSKQKVWYFDLLWLTICLYFVPVLSKRSKNPTMHSIFRTRTKILLYCNTLNDFLYPNGKIFQALQLGGLKKCLSYQNKNLPWENRVVYC